MCAAAAWRAGGSARRRDPRGGWRPGSSSSPQAWASSAPPAGAFLSSCPSRSSPFPLSSSSFHSTGSRRRMRRLPRRRTDREDAGQNGGPAAPTVDAIAALAHGERAASADRSLSRASAGGSAARGWHSQWLPAAARPARRRARTRARAGVRAPPYRVRQQVSAELGFLGVAVDDESNVRLRGEGEIAAASSTARIRVVESREDVVIAREARRLV